MNNREAQFVLSAYRPGGQDAADPQFSEALAQARRDPVVERWFKDSTAFDRAVTEKLCAVEVPAGLRESILAGGKVSHPSRWAKPFVRWAIAAAVVLGAIAGSLVLREAAKPPRLAAWQTNALGQISALTKGHSKFDAESRNQSELVAWLRANHAPVAQTVPQNLGKLASLGCKTFSWEGQPVSVICFMREDGGLVHLVVTTPATPMRTGTERQPQIVTEGPWTTATWRDGETVYMVALEGSREQLRYLL
ncbi:MAG: hypothetical protein ABJB22_01160 [Verrucomicrobiota bacterium]